MKPFPLQFEAEADRQPNWTDLKLETFSKSEKVAFGRLRITTSGSDSGKLARVNISPSVRTISVQAPRVCILKIQFPCRWLLWINCPQFHLPREHSPCAKSYEQTPGAGRRVKVEIQGRQGNTTLTRCPATYNQHRIRARNYFHIAFTQANVIFTIQDGASRQG